MSSDWKIRCNKFAYPRRGTEQGFHPACPQMFVQLFDGKSLRPAMSWSTPQCQCICDMTIDDVNTVRSIGADCAMLRKHLRADSCCYRTAVEIDVQKVTWQTASLSTLSSQASLVSQYHLNCLLLQVLLHLGFVPRFDITFVIMFPDTLYNIGIKYFAICWHCLLTCSVICGHSILCFSLHAL